MNFDFLHSWNLKDGVKTRMVYHMRHTNCSVNTIGVFAFIHRFTAFNNLENKTVGITGQAGRIIFWGCFLVLRKTFLGSYCAVVWVLFFVFCFFCFTSLGDHNTKKPPIFELSQSSFRELPLQNKRNDAMRFFKVFQCSNTVS